MVKYKYLTYVLRTQLEAYVKISMNKKEKREFIKVQNKKRGQYVKK